MNINKKSLILIFLLFILVFSIFNIEKNTYNSTEIKVARDNIKNINKILETKSYIDKLWVGNENIDIDKMYEEAIRGMVKSLNDPYSEYLSKEDFDFLNETIDKSYVGIGIEMKKEKGDYIEVISPFIGTPAYNSGIQIGDIITKVDGEDIIELSAQEVSKKLKGKENTEVKLEIHRKGINKPIELTLVRKKIKLKNIEYKMLDDNIGYISLLNFSTTSSDEVKQSLLELEKKGMKKLIFDLRSNPGGSLQDAIKIASMFIDEDLVLTLNTKNNGNRKYSRVGEKIFDGDMVILVNSGSASASEIVTGVLKDYKRATIIGTKTFGKGVAQGIYPLSNSDDYLKLTIAEYYTPYNKNINKNGIEPDIVVEMNNLVSIKGILEETEEAKENRKKEIEKILEKLEGRDKAKEIIKNGDVQLKKAIDFLK